MSRPAVEIEHLHSRRVRAAALFIVLLSASVPAQALGGEKAIRGPHVLRDGRSAFPMYELGGGTLQLRFKWSQVALARPASATDPADPACTS